MGNFRRLLFRSQIESSLTEKLLLIVTALLIAVIDAKLPILDGDEMFEAAHLPEKVISFRFRQNNCRKKVIIST
jgi:hypothetical protein